MRHDGRCCADCLWSVFFPLTDCVDWLPVGNDTDALLEYSPCVEKWQRNAHDALQPVLNPSEPGAFGVLHLVKDLVLSERVHWHQVGTVGKADA